MLTRTLLPSLLALPLALAACAGDDASTAGDSETGTSTTSGDETPPLGERASALCRDAMSAWPALAAAADGAAIEAAYVGTPLQEYVRASDPAGERGDDAAILAAIAEATPESLAGVRPRLQAALAARYRAEIVKPELLDPAPGEAWDEGYCLWNTALRPLAEAAGEPGLVAAIDTAFADGHAGIDGTSIDDWAIPPAKQVAEKSLFTAAHRVILAEASAAAGGDRAAARRALEIFGIVRDRLKDRNTPGIAVIEAMLEDPMATVDVAEIERHMNIAFAKRTRKYCSEAVETDALGVPTGYKGVVEGRTYQRLLAPDMAERLAGDGFDAAAYAQVWDDFVAAVESGDDPAAAAALSATLVDWNCAYQAALGIASCTASDDEPAP